MRHGLNAVEIVELPNIRFSFHDFFMFMASFTHNIGFRRKLKYLFQSTLNLKQHYLSFCMELDAPPSFLLDPKGSNYVKKRKQLILHPKPTNKLVSTHSEHFWCWDKPRATRTHLTHHGPDSGEATTFPHIIFFALLYHTHIQMAFIPGTPKEESRNCSGLDSRDFGNS